MRKHLRIRIAKFKTLTPPNAGKGMEQQQLSFMGHANGMATLEDSLEVSYKTKHTHTTSSNTHTLVYTQLS